MFINEIRLFACSLMLFSFLEVRGTDLLLNFCSFPTLFELPVEFLQKLINFLELG